MKIKQNYLESYKNLKVALSSSGIIPEKIMENILSLFKPCHFPRQTIILNDTQQKKQLFFIHKGLVRLYYKNGNTEVIKSFEAEGSFFGNNNSNAENYGLFMHAETLEESFILVAPMNEINALTSGLHQIERFSKLFLEQRYARLTKHMIDIKSQPAKQRYLNFVNNNSELAHRIPMKYIANYLGVKGETISRIRSNFPDYSKNLSASS